MKRLEHWQRAIRSASSESVVINVLRDYMAQWTPGELAQLPEDCRPGSLLDAESVSQWAVHLTRRELKFAGSREAADLLHGLASVFVEASSRLAQLGNENRLLGPRSDALAGAVE
jgi:hypothetical protein